METTQVIFISLMDIKKMPTFKGREQLNFLQAEFRNFYWELFKSCNDKYEMAVRKQQMQNKLRDTIHIVKD